MAETEALVFMSNDKNRKKQATEDNYLRSTLCNVYCYVMPSQENKS